MKRLVCLIIAAAVTGCSGSPTGVSSTCREQRSWTYVNQYGDTVAVANRNQSLCQQTTFGTAGAP